MKFANNPYRITGDDHLIDRATKAGTPLNTVDISDCRVDADDLSKLFNTAAARADDDNAALRYAALKEKYFESYDLRQPADDVEPEEEEPEE